MTQRSSFFSRFAGPVLFSTSLLLGMGCSSSDNPPESETESVTEDSVASGDSKTETATVAAANTTHLTSPASGGTNRLNADASPRQVCQQFMQLLQSGNRIAAENFLTLTASTVTTKAGLVLEPMGGPSAVYKITEVRYATNKNILAQVECIISDEENGEVFEMPITWLVRKQRIGWRISGVLLELETGQALDLLSFENIHDVTRMKNMAGSEVLDQSTITRQADADPSVPNVKY